MAAAAVDVPFLSGHLGVPQEAIASLIASAAADLASVVFGAVASKAREFDSLYAEKLKVDIELENAVVSSETRCQSFKATADKALKDVEALRQQLKEEGTICFSILYRPPRIKLTQARRASQRPRGSRWRMNCNKSAPGHPTMNPKYSRLGSESKPSKPLIVRTWHSSSPETPAITSSPMR